MLHASDELRACCPALAALADASGLADGAPAGAALWASAPGGRPGAFELARCAETAPSGRPAHVRASREGVFGPDAGNAVYHQVYITHSAADADAFLRREWPMLLETPSGMAPVYMATLPRGARAKRAALRRAARGGALAAATQRFAVHGGPPGGPRTAAAASVAVAVGAAVHKVFVTRAAPALPSAASVDVLGLATDYAAALAAALLDEPRAAAAAAGAGGLRGPLLEGLMACKPLVGSSSCQAISLVGWMRG
ncbi:MAG: hypothetical protein J3K34DRAFT_69080 [Monoraphidium minutum]|nr:MAG: hypothetical protein J3K34DRAFT_69080 [Monoraphidium minutum]